jgi:hypothetical protein
MIQLPQHFCLFLMSSFPAFKHKIEIEKHENLIILLFLLLVDLNFTLKKETDSKLN